MSRRKRTAVFCIGSDPHGNGEQPRVERYFVAEGEPGDEYGRPALAYSATGKVGKYIHFDRVFQSPEDAVRAAINREKDRHIKAVGLLAKLLEEK
jgi:hypothetical protein